MSAENYLHRLESWSWWVTRPGVLGTAVTYRCVDGPPVGTRKMGMEHECLLPDQEEPWTCEVCGASYELRKDLYAAEEKL